MADLGMVDLGKVGWGKVELVELGMVGSHRDCYCWQVLGIPKLVVEKLGEETTEVEESLHRRSHLICISQRPSIDLWNTYRPMRLSYQVHGAAGAASAATPFSIGAATDKALNRCQ